MGSQFKENILVERAAQLSMWVVPKKNEQNPLCRSQITFGRGSLMVWNGISITRKRNILIIRESFSPEWCNPAILQPVASPFKNQISLCNMSLTLIRGQLQNLGMERMERCPSSPGFDPCEHLLHQFWLAVVPVWPTQPHITAATGGMECHLTAISSKLINC